MMYRIDRIERHRERKRGKGELRKGGDLRPGLGVRLCELSCFVEVYFVCC
jgi:hypothetical protein